MKASNANKVISVLLSVAMCPMMVPSAAFAAEDDAASDASSPSDQTQPADQAEGDDAGASLSDTITPQSEATGEASDTPTGEAAASVAGANEEGAEAPTAEEGTEAAVAEVNGTNYPSLQAAIDAAKERAVVKLLADTKENVTISTKNVTLDLNGHTLNGGTEKGKPALTVTARVTVMDSSAAQTGTIMREDTAENSGISSHYVIDVQGGKSGWLFFQSGNVKNDSGAGGTKGASLVRVGDDSKPGLPHMTITGGTFTQNNFIVLKCDSGILSVAGGTINSANSYAIQNWKTTYIKDGDHGASRPVINGNVSTWTYNGSGSSLEISGGTVNGNVESVTYDGVEGNPAKASITGGVVKGTLNTVDYSTGTTSNDPAKATIEVTGGTFSTDPSRYLIEGSAATPNGDGTFGVAKAYLAQVGETSYYTMGEAFDAQTKTGKAITLLRDYTTGSTFNSGTETRVVDLNGHTWTCTGTDANSAAFEINYSNASLTVKNGKIVSSQLIGLIPSAMGGTIKYDNSTLTFEGVEATTTATSGIETNGNNANDTVVLKDSTLNVPNGFGIYFPSSGTLTIDNSTINAKTMGAQVCSGNLNVTAGSAITVSGDPVKKLEGDGAIQDGAAISIVNRPGYKGLDQIAITGGTFTAKAGNAALKAYTWDSATKQESTFDNSAKTVAVYGGTFSSSVPEALCAEGCKPIENLDGTHGVSGSVAQVGFKAFNTLQAAIDAAQDGETVTLLADATEDATISAGKNITLDLGGKTLTNTNTGKATLTIAKGATAAVKNGNVIGGTSFYTIQNNGTATLEDVTATAGNNDSSMIDNYGTLTITSGTYTGGLDTVKNEPNAKLTITGGTFTLTKGNSKGFTGVVFNYGELTISGGEFIQSDKSAPYAQAQVIHTDKSGSTVPSTVISGGTFKNLCSKTTAWTVRETNAANGATKVSGGTFNKSISEGFCADGFIPTKNADGTYGVKEGHYVAQIGSKKYETLADAIHWATKGKTITLLTDVEQNSQLTIGKSITLDLNGKTIKNTVDIWGDNTNAILSIANGAKVTITGNGTMDAKENDCYTINVKKGDLTIENGTFYGNVSVVQVQEGTLSVKGGTFDLHQKWEGSSKYLFNCIDDAYAKGSANVAISGGTFVGFDPSASPEGEGSSYLAPGYAPTDNGNGTYGVVAGVAQIGTKAYTSLQAAVDAAQDGETIQLLNDITENITINASKQITLDLNGHTLNGGTGTAKAAILNEGTVTITDTSAGKTGTIKRDDQGIEGETSYYVIKNIGTMVIDQANVVNNSGYKKANSSGSMVGSSLICNGDDDPQASLTINGGTFNQPNFLVVKNGTNGTLTVNGGTLTSNHSAVQNWNKAQILSGSLTGQIWTDAWVEGAIGETIIGGDAQFTGEIVVDITGKVPPTLKIEGGSLDVTSWRVTSAAAAANATVAVSGGTFTAAVPENYCAEGYAPVDNGDGTYGVKLAEGAYLLQNYRTGDQASWTYPIQEGMAFAGWYKDAAFKTPCTESDVEGAAYAKFVNITDLLKYKGRSLRMDNGDPSETTYLRFGYTKAIPNGATYIENGWYYKRLSAPTGDDIRFAAYNNALNDDGTITSNLVFNNVKARLYTANFIEKAFVKYATIDGTTVEAVEGAYHSSSVSEAADAILAHPMASKAEKDYATSIKSAIKSAIQ